MPPPPPRLRVDFTPHQAAQGPRNREEGNKGEVFLEVETFSELEDEAAQIDPYRRYPVCGGKLFSVVKGKVPVLLLLRDVICHGAVTPFGDQFFASAQEKPFPSPVQW